MNVYRKTLAYSILTFLIIFATLQLTSCADADKIYDSMLPNFIIISVHTVSTIILIICSIWLVWNPTKQIMDKRRKIIEKALLDSEENKKKSFEMLLEAEKKKIEAYEEANHLVEKAKEEANFKFNSIIHEAQDDALRINENAAEEIKVLKAKIEEDNDKQISDISLAIASELIKKNINQNDNQQLIDDFIKTFKEGKN